MSYAETSITITIVYVVKVQREALAESSVVFSRVFGNKMGRRLMVVEEGLFSGIATSTVQVSTQGIHSHVHYRSQVI